MHLQYKYEYVLVPECEMKKNDSAWRVQYRSTVQFTMNGWCRSNGEWTIDNGHADAQVQHSRVERREPATHAYMYSFKYAGWILEKASKRRQGRSGHRAFEYWVLAIAIDTGLGAPHVPEAEARGQDRINKQAVSGKMPEPEQPELRGLSLSITWELHTGSRTLKLAHNQSDTVVLARSGRSRCLVLTSWRFRGSSTNKWRYSPGRGRAAHHCIELKNRTVTLTLIRDIGLSARIGTLLHYYKYS